MQIEFKTTATGVTAADAMVKTSDVEIVEAQTVCPGKYIAIITGDLSAVKAAVDTAVTTYEDKCIDSFVLGNPHESLFPAIYGTTQVEEISALGILETYDAASIIEAADQAAKTAIVDLIELRMVRFLLYPHQSTERKSLLLKKACIWIPLLLHIRIRE